MTTMTQQTRPDPDSSRPAAPAAHRDDELDGVVTRHGLAGETLGESLLRVHTAETGALADEFLALHLAPQVAQALVPVAVDWRGRQYARLTVAPVESARTAARDVVVRVDPAHQQARALVEFSEFVELLTHPGRLEELQRLADDVDRRAAFSRIGLERLDEHRCLALPWPVFAGGQDSPDLLAEAYTSTYLSYFGAMAAQMRRAPEGAMVVGRRLTESGPVLVFDTDQDPEFTGPAGVPHARLHRTGDQAGPTAAAYRDDELDGAISQAGVAGAEYNHGLLHVVDAGSGPEVDRLLRAAFPDDAETVVPIALDWRGRVLARRLGHGVVDAFDPSSLQREELLSLDLLLAALEGTAEDGGARVATLLGEGDKAALCARLRLHRLPATVALASPVPAHLTGVDEPMRRRVVPWDEYWDLSVRLHRTAAELDPALRVQGYLFTPDGELKVQAVPRTEAPFVPAPDEDQTAGVAPRADARRHQPVADTGVHVTQRVHNPASGRDVLTGNLLTWFEIAGTQYNHGLFRFLSAPEAEQAASLLREFFGIDDVSTVPLIMDWRGRVFVQEAVDHTPMLVGYDPATASRTEIADLASVLPVLLLTDEPLRMFDDATRRRAFDAVGITALDPGQCLAPTLSPLLGGALDATNVTLDAVESHWAFHGHLHAQVRQQPAGARVTAVEMDDSGFPTLRFATD